MKIPRLLLTAPSSGSGKTMITCGILQALKNRKLRPVSYKCGPDYIDPMFHSRVLGTKSRNLDTFFTDRDTVRYLLAKNAGDGDLAVLEGVMGYYDGLGGVSSRASAWETAVMTETPAVLIVNSRGASVSILAQIQGFLEFENPSRIQGIILNQVSPMMYPRMKQMIEERLPVKVYGYVPVWKELQLTSRHLGLLLPEEILDLQEKLEAFAEKLEETLDLDGLIQLAGQAVELPEECPEQLRAKLEPLKPKHTQRPVRIGLASDEAFCFFYADNLDLLSELGAELIPFSPIRDRELPSDLDGLLLYGGYPELHAKELAQNCEMREQIRQVVKSGMPCMAECGGFLYLLEELETPEGEVYPMAGVLKGKGYNTGKLSRFGYVTLTEGKSFGNDAGPIPAHEFHYYDTQDCGDDYLASKPAGSRKWRCIHSEESLHAGFPHLYYYGNPSVAGNFLDACRKWRSKT